MSSERVNLYLVRFVEFANVCVFLYLAWVIDATELAGPRSKSENGLTNGILFLAAAPFCAAFITSFRE